MRTDTYDEELEPCPFCGSDNISTGECLTDLGEGRRSSQSQCLNCGALGPDGILEKDDGPDYGSDKARASWNRRTPPSAQSVEPVAMVRKLVNMSIIDSTGCKTSWEDLPDGTKLYTSPPSAEGARDAALEDAAVASEIPMIGVYPFEVRRDIAQRIRALKSKKES